MNLKIFEETLMPLARDIVGQRYRHVAAISYRGNILSLGQSSRKTHPFAAQYGSKRGKMDQCMYWHAETHAVHNFLRLPKYDISFLEKCELYVCRLRKNQEGELNYGLSKPCKGCSTCIEEYRLSRVFYTLNTSLEKPEFGVYEP